LPPPAPCRSWAKSSPARAARPSPGREPPTWPRSPSGLDARFPSKLELPAPGGLALVLHARATARQRPVRAAAARRARAALAPWPLPPLLAQARFRDGHHRRPPPPGPGRAPCPRDAYLAASTLSSFTLCLRSIDGVRQCQPRPARARPARPLVAQRPVPEGADGSPEADGARDGLGHGSGLAGAATPVALAGALGTVARRSLGWSRRKSEQRQLRARRAGGRARSPEARVRPSSQVDSQLVSSAHSLF